MSVIGTLDHTKKQHVSYCIPIELRDLQIKYALKRIKPRIAAGERREDAVAVVCFGPSLAATWEAVKGYDTIISCSGAHKFLVERGITPTYHVEVDPRPHKVKLIGEPQDATTYLIASTCCKAVFDHLDGHDVRLWHVFDSKEEGMRILPPGEWQLTGGCDVGSRAITIAGFLGFRDVHVFGMDGCQQGDAKHADAHPNEPKAYSLTTYQEVEYKTTPALLEAARMIFHELDQMPAVRATFHGEGLVQAMARDYVQKHADESKPFQNTVAFQKQPLISPAYAKLNAQLHDDRVDFGLGGGKHAKATLALATHFKTSSVLDYGCGKSQLARALPFPIWEYDPGVPGKEETPPPADIVVCTDVLEHIEPECVDAVLADIHRCTKKIAYLVIHTGPSTKSLADGRNAHLIQKNKKWWQARLERHFTVSALASHGPLITFVAEPKARRVAVPKPAYKQDPQPLMEEARV